MRPGFARCRNYMPETPDRRSGHCHGLPAVCLRRHCAADERASCRPRSASSGPARSAARWRAGWPAPGSPPWWWIAPRCRRWSTRRSMAAPTPSPPARADCWSRPACGTRWPRPACPILDIRVSDGRLGRPASPLFLHFAHREAGDDAAVRPHGGGAQPARGAERAHARAARAARVRAGDSRGGAARGRRHRPHRRRSRASTAGWSWRRKAATRRCAERPAFPVTQLPYDQTGIVCAISHAASAPQHGARALPALRPVRATADVRQPRRTGGRRAERLRHRMDRAHADRAAHAGAGRCAASSRQIARRLGDHLGAVRVVGRRWSYPLGAMHAHRYFDTRLVLVGDAAHTIHPIAGQGLNLGFRDAIALADLLIEASRRGEDLGAPDAAAALPAAAAAGQSADAGGDRHARSAVQQRQPLLRLARDVGIAAVHRAPPLKRLFMRQAMGLPAIPLLARSHIAGLSVRIMPATGGTRHAGQAGHRRHHSELRPRRAAATVSHGWLWKLPSHLLPPHCRAPFRGRRMPRPKPPHSPSRQPKRTTCRAFMAMTRWS